MTLKPLYCRDSNEGVRVWKIEVEGNKFRTISGIVDGAEVISEWTVVDGKNVGRANETSPEAQALKEAKAKHKKKKDLGYFESLGDIDQSVFVEPMLAKNYDDYKEDIQFPVFSQGKLDGIRCVISKNGMFSRNGKPFVACPHIFDTLSSIFIKYPNYVFDGELYADKLKTDFNRICSLVKKSKPTAADIRESEENIQYWIYDLIVPEKAFSVRQMMLKSVITDGKYLKLLPTEDAWSQGQLDALYETYVQNGLEGQIVRLDKPYEHKRSRNLLKRKEFQDAEYRILDVVEGVGNRQGMAGYMVFHTKLGQPFHSNIKGDHSFLKKCLEDRYELIGKMATIKYFNLTPDNQVPRFPFVIAIRDYE